MIFDDYGWDGLDLTKRGIDGYYKRIKLLGESNTPIFIKKNLNNFVFICFPLCIQLFPIIIY
jgi:hypothetical protein